MESKTYLPNYKDGSIVNLMSSIGKVFGKNFRYQPLKDFDISGISKKNIVLITIDGLGYEYLLKYGKGSFLSKNLKRKMTSVLPATTAAAMTSFATGVAPQQHAMTGWFMYLKEIGTVAVILPFVTRAGNFQLGKGDIKYQDVYDQRSFFEDLKVTSISVKHRDYFESEYSLLATRNTTRLPFAKLNGFFRQIRKALKMNGKRKFVFAYWGELDSICHRKGTDSAQAEKHFKELDRRIASLAKYLKNRNTAIIVTADHGLIDTREQNKIIELKNHPKFAETLAVPLSGEPRFAYCYVRPSKVKQFEGYAKTEFKNVCEIYKSEDLIKKNYFGLFEPSKKLKDRVGDYTLIMKENYIMKDLVFGEKQNIFIGNHGGTSKEEMFVPLVVVE